MKRIVRISLLGLLLCFTACEEDAIVGCTDESAINYDPNATEDNQNCLYLSADNIYGEWNLVQIESELDISPEMVAFLISLAQDMDPEEFEEEYGVEMPSSPEEWIALEEMITYLVEVLEDTAIEFTEQGVVNIYEDGEYLESVPWELVDPTHFNMSYEDIGSVLWTIDLLDENNLHFSGAAMEQGIAVNLTITCDR